MEAIRRGARAVDGVKFRTRAGFGRCQGGWCTDAVLAREARQAMLLSRVRYGAEAMPARKALWMATVGGARVMGWEEVGSLEPGKVVGQVVEALVSRYPSLRPRFSAIFPPS